MLMKLLTKEIERKLVKAQHNTHGMDTPVVVKYFNPYGLGTWLVTEAEKQEDGDWMLYGYCKIFEAEWGYTMLSELQNVRPLRGMNLGIERDLYTTGTVAELSKDW